MLPDAAHRHPSRLKVRSDGAPLDGRCKDTYPLHVMKSRISSKGQITVPVAVRERLGLWPGTVVHFEVREGGALLKKGHHGKHPVDAVYGRLRLDGAVDEVVDGMRGPRPSAPSTKGGRRRSRKT